MNARQSVFKKIVLACPRCGASKTVSVSDFVPRQTFDFKCCGGQTATSRVIAVRPEFTAREITWEVVDATAGA